MDSKTRVLTALACQKPDRTPFNFWMDRRLMADYERRIGHRHWRVTHYGADVIETFAPLAFPSGPQIEQDGTNWQTGPYLNDWRDVDTVPMPDPNADSVYEIIKADLAEFPDKAVFLDMITPWGVISGIRTHEMIYMDMYEYPEEFKRLSKRIAAVQRVAIEKAIKMGITALYLMEDLATTKGLAMSPAMIQEFCLDYIQEFIDMAKSAGIPVLFHSDGTVTDLVGMLKERGIDAVNPLQPHLNDAAEFKKRFDGTLAVYGGLDNCFIIPDGTPQQVRDHVLDVFDKLGRKDGGLIFSTHDIPLKTPKENVEAMVGAIRECTY